MVASWVRNVCLEKTLLDGGSLVELINRKLVARMKPRPKIFSNQSQFSQRLIHRAVRICQDSG